MKLQADGRISKIRAVSESVMVGTAQAPPSIPLAAETNAHDVINGQTLEQYWPTLNGTYTDINPTGDVTWPVVNVSRHNQQVFLIMTRYLPEQVEMIVFNHGTDLQGVPRGEGNRLRCDKGSTRILVPSCTYEKVRGVIQVSLGLRNNFLSTNVVLSSTWVRSPKEDVNHNKNALVEACSWGWQQVG